MCVYVRVCVCYMKEYQSAQLLWLFLHCIMVATFKGIYVEPPAWHWLARTENVGNYCSEMAQKLLCCVRIANCYLVSSLQLNRRYSLALYLLFEP